MGKCESGIKGSGSYTPQPTKNIGFGFLGQMGAKVINYGGELGSYVVSKGVVPLVDCVFTNAIQHPYDAVGYIVKGVWDNGGSKAVNAGKSVVNGVYDNILRPGYNNLLSLLGSKVIKLIVTKSWKGVTEVVKFVWQNFIQLPARTIKEVVKFTWSWTGQPALKFVTKILSKSSPKRTKNIKKINKKVEPLSPSKPGLISKVVKWIFT